MLDDEFNKPQTDKSVESVLPDALAAASRTDETHFELAELTQLADQRRAKGEAWEMPPHLSRCTLCLEMFQILMEGVGALPGEAFKRFVDLRKNTDQPSANVIPLPSRWKTRLAIAAAVAVLLAVFGFLTYFTGKSPARVSAGSITLPNGEQLPSGATIPSGILVTASEATSTTLEDGSNIGLTKDTQVSFRHSLGGNTTIALATGSVTASVTKQKKGNEFIVRTPLGEVAVVGTKFSVTCQAEDVVVYQSTPGQTPAAQHHDIVRAMRVAVTEGSVRVRRQGEQVLVQPNQTAVLLENEPGIEVLGSKP